MITIMLGGVSGVGKTTIGKNLMNSCSEKCVFYSIGEFLREEAKLQNATISSLSLSERKDISRRRFYSSLEEARKSGAQLFILDSHFAVPKKSGYDYPFGEGIKEDFDAIVILTAPVQEIQKRRMVDKTKNRDLDSNRIDQDQNEVIKRATYLTQITGLPCLFIENIIIDDTVKKIAEYVDSLPAINKRR